MWQLIISNEFTFPCGISFNGKYFGEGQMNIRSFRSYLYKVNSGIEIRSKFKLMEVAMITTSLKQWKIQGFL